MYFFLNTSIYVASILSETHLTVFNMKGCMMPKCILILCQSLYLLHRQTKMDMCTCLSQIILHSVFYKHPFKITICWGLGKIYPCECPRMLPDSIFWTTCHYLITFHKHLSDCDFYDNKFPTPLFNMPIQSSCLISVLNKLVVLSGKYP